MNRPRLETPAGACDCHMHIYDDRYPTVSTAAFPNPSAPLPEYRKVQRQLRLERVIVVQPSGYGFDNQCTLEAVEALGPSARAIVVIKPETPAAELSRLHAMGARGVRFHMLPGGVLPWDALEAMAARVAPLGWHIQLQLDGRTLPEYEARLGKLPCDLVIDHNGKFLEPVATDHPGFQVLLRLLASGRCWMKVSAPYETSKIGPPRYEDVAVLARALIEAAPERCVWASNWPHPNRKTLPDNAALLDLLLDWAGSDAVRRRILADNPARLYGFDASP
jgi:D-galactarolactone isomerase